MGDAPLVLFNPLAASSVSVSDFWSDTGWDMERVLAVLPVSIVEQIIQVPISQPSLDLIR